MNFKRFGRTAQLFDYQNMASGTTGKYLNDSGEEIVSSIWDITGYIPCDGMNFTVARLGGNTPSICLYDGNKTFIAGQSYNSGGGGTKTAITISSETQAKYIRFSYLNGAVTSPDDLSAIMLNEGLVALPYQPYMDWTNIPHYIMGADTDTLTTLPADIYANDTTATVGLKGQAVQSGTLTPENPVMPQGCGERTGNLADVMPFSSKWATVFPNLVTFLNQLAAGNYTLSYDIELTQRNNVSDNSTYGIAIIGAITQNTLRWDTAEVGTIRRVSHSFTISTGMAGNIERAYAYGCGINGVGATGEARFSNIMLNTGSTAKPFEPFGVKIPISSANTTTPVYLGEVQTTRKIEKLVLTGEENFNELSAGLYRITENGYMRSADTLVGMCSHFGGGYTVASAPTSQQNTISFLVSGSGNNYIYFSPSQYLTKSDFKTYLAAQYAAGTPVTVWYVLATPTTGIVNEPLMKIGNYADTVSNVSIPVTVGGDTISVGTTVQPSEVTVNYKGWHSVADVHEFTGNYTVGTMQTLPISELETHTISDLQGGEWS